MVPTDHLDDATSDVISAFPYGEGQSSECFKQRLKP